MTGVITDTGIIGANTGGYVLPLLLYYLYCYRVWIWTCLNGMNVSPRF